VVVASYSVGETVRCIAVLIMDVCASFVSWVARISLITEFIQLMVTAIIIFSFHRKLQLT
jgi:hypothetical protein